MREDNEDTGIGELLAPVRDGFVIDSEWKATWVLGKIGAVRNARESLHNQYAAMARSMQGEEDRLLNRFGPDLEAWAKARMGGGRKSVKLLTGMLAFRTVPAALKMVDDLAARDFAEESNLERCFEVVKKFKEGEYKALASLALKESGEVFPGMELLDEQDRFYIRVSTNLHEGED